MTLRRERIQKTTKMFETPQGRQYTANAIRCGKYRQKQKEKIAKCPYTALEYLQHSFAYAETIQEISSSPFSVMYRSPSQLQLYKAYKKHNTYTKVSCDATAGLAHRLKRPGKKLSGQINLYDLVISDGFQVTVNSLLSEKNDANKITNWLSEWIRLGASIPNEYVCDMSLALISGAIRAFTNHNTTSDYVDFLYELHRTSGDIRNPACFIRIDFAHLMKAVVKCKPLHSARKKAKDFFVRCVALLAIMTTLEEAELHIFATFVVAFSKTEGQSTDGEDVPCEIYKSQIIKRITGKSQESNGIIERVLGESKDTDETENEDTRKSDDQNEILFDTSTFLQWIRMIRDEAFETASAFDNGNRDNLMFNKPFASHFYDLCKMLPLWSAISCKFFDTESLTGSSANSESNFKNVKQTHKDIIPCSVDILVKALIDSTNAAVIDASTKYITRIGDYSGNDTNNCKYSTDSIPTQCYISDVNDISDDATNHSDINININNDTSDVTGGDDVRANALYASRKNITFGDHSRNLDINNDTSDVTGGDDGRDDGRADAHSDAHSDAHYASRKNIAFGDNSRNIDINNDASDVTGGDDIRADAHSEKIEFHHANENIECIACNNNDFPSDAHVCSMCQKNVHVLPGCSIGMGEEEGYGEKRICKSCATSIVSPSTNIEVFGITSKKRKLSPVTITTEKAATELNHKEQWKKKKTKRSLYTKPSPNWNLNVNIDKKAKLGFLRNGNVSHSTYKVNKTTVAIKNTCSFDSVAQVLAAAYAYNDAYRNIAKNSQDKIFEVAILLAENANLNKINHLRAEVFCKLFGETRCAMGIANPFAAALKQTPTYTETLKCSRVRCKSKVVNLHSHVSLKSDVFNNDFEHLEEAIRCSFSYEVKCKTCKRVLCISREFSHQLFIEMPPSNYQPSHSVNEFPMFKLKEVPLSVQVQSKLYILHGVFVFEPPLIEGDVGHNVGAIKINNTFEVYDDLRLKPYTMRSNERVYISALCYLLKDVSN